MVFSTVIDSVTSTNFSFTGQTDAAAFYIQEVGIDGETGLSVSDSNCYSPVRSTYT